MTEYVLAFALPRWYDFEQSRWWPGTSDLPGGGGKVLVVYKDRPAWQAGRINLPGGKVEPGESPVEAAVRELKEETGLDPLAGYQPELHGIVEGTKSRIYHVRLWVDSDQPICPREGETEKFEWAAWDSLLVDRRLMPNLRVTVPLMRSGFPELRNWHVEDRNKYEPEEVVHYVTLTIPKLHESYMCSIGCRTGMVEYIRIGDKDERQEDQRGEGRDSGESDRTGPGPGRE